MTIDEIEREIEHVEKATEANTDMKLIQGLQAKALWQIALQLAYLLHNSPRLLAQHEAKHIKEGR